MRMQSVKGLIQRLERVQACEKRIPENLREVMTNLPNPAEVMAMNAENTDVSALYAQFIGGLEAISDVARDYADATHDLVQYVRAELEPGLEAKGLMPKKPWTPPEVH